MTYKGKYIEISMSDDGIRLDRWFKRHHPDLPHTRLENMLRRGEVRLDQMRVKASTRIATGQMLRFMPFAEKIRTRATIQLTQQQEQKLLKQVLYYDDRLIALNKPAGLAVQGGTKLNIHLDLMLDALRFGGERPRLVHRLDKATSGVLLLGRSASAASELSKFFRTHQIQKTYWALTDGVPKPERGQISEAINERSAKTEYELIDQFGKDLAWLAFRPITGRNHQLRIHAAHLGTPIIGDPNHPGRFHQLLGKKPAFQLHAQALILPYGLSLTAPLPAHMEQIWHRLGFEFPKLDSA